MKPNVNIKMEIDDLIASDSGGVYVSSSNGVPFPPPSPQSDSDSDASFGASEDGMEIDEEGVPILYDIEAHLEEKYPGTLADELQKLPPPRVINRFMTNSDVAWKPPSKPSEKTRMWSFPVRFWYILHISGD